MRNASAKKAGGCKETWAKNLAALKARPEDLDFLPPLPHCPPVFQKVKFLAGEHPSLKVMGEEGRGVTLHSTRRAWAEAEEWARAAPLGKSSYLVALGLGLGYHLLSLLPHLREDQHLVLVEQEPEVLWAALSTLDLTRLLSRPRTRLVVRPEAEEAVRHLQGMLPRREAQGPAFFGHPPSLRAHKAYYQEVISRLRPIGGGAVRPLGLKKDNLKILLINPDYFLIPEVMRACRQLGHQVHLALFDKRRDQGEVVLRQLLEEVRDFAPDLVFTVNHLGFDREGLLVDTLHRLRVPSVSWYVDSPAIILSLYDGPQSDLAFIFVWDPTYIPEVRSLGFERVFPLPLATDPEVFSPERARGNGRRSPVAFVGNSLLGSVQQKLARLPDSEDFQELFNRLGRAFKPFQTRGLDSLLAAEGLTDDPLLQGLDRQGLNDLQAALLWRATLEYRLTCVRELEPFGPVIYGDPGWRELLGQGFVLRPEVNYYDELPQVYGASAINFNATSLQMKAAVNQRIFDAPAAGGFVLTDFREQLAELFEVGEEVACFGEPGEIPDLVRFYLRQPQLREKMTTKARRRVLAEHTYRHRVTVMLETMRRSL
jgi:spore maturation protein CgeB